MWFTNSVVSRTSCCSMLSVMKRARRVATTALTALTESRLKIRNQATSPTRRGRWAWRAALPWLVPCGVAKASPWAPDRVFIASFGGASVGFIRGSSGHQVVSPPARLAASAAASVPGAGTASGRVARSGAEQDGRGKGRDRRGIVHAARAHHRPRPALRPRPTKGHGPAIRQGVGSLAMRCAPIHDHSTRGPSAAFHARLLAPLSMR